MLVRLVPILVLAGLAAGCASSASAPPPLAAWEAPKLSPAEQRGHDFAVRRCGGCHNVGLDDGPPYEGPTFRKLGMRFNPISLSRRFAEVSAHGYDSMPPIEFTRAEAEDLLAYVATLPAP